MVGTDRAAANRVLLVNDNDAVSLLMNRALERKGFEVVAANNLPDALRRIASDNFDVLIADLHLPSSNDGFAVVTAMRHFQPDALTLLVSGYPDMQSAMGAIVLEADEIIVKPFEINRLTDVVVDRLANRRPVTRLNKQRVGQVLTRCVGTVVARWLARAKQSDELNCLLLSDEQRTGHLPRLVEDLAQRLGCSSNSAKDSDAIPSPAAVAHGELRYRQGYTPAMLVHESRIPQVSIFGTLQENCDYLDFNLLLPDVMAIADEVDSQLTQAVDSYMKLMRSKAA